MKHYRTARNAYLWILKNDPDTAISERMIRDLMKNGVIPTIKQGNKLMLSLEDLQNYLTMDLPTSGGGTCG